jgi:hypothetical protein
METAVYSVAGIVMMAVLSDSWRVERARTPRGSPAQTWRTYIVVDTVGHSPSPTIPPGCGAAGKPQVGAFRPTFVL